MDYLKDWQVIADKKSNKRADKIYNLFKKNIKESIKQIGFFLNIYYHIIPNEKIILIYAQGNEYDKLLKYIESNNKIIHQYMINILNEEKEVGT
jgi:hypothetical protein